MSDDSVNSQTVDRRAVDYEGFEIHISTRLKDAVVPASTASTICDSARKAARFTYIGYV